MRSERIAPTVLLGYGGERKVGKEMEQAVLGLEVYSWSVTSDSPLLSLAERERKRERQHQSTRQHQTTRQAWGLEQAS